MTLQTQRLYVGGLFEDITERDLSSRFSPFGKVEECTVIRDSLTGNCRGFGYISLTATEEKIKKCTALYNGSKWKGMQLKLEKANETYLERLKTQRQQEEESNQIPQEPKKMKLRKAPLNTKHAEDMSPVLDKTVDKRKGWKRGRYGRGIAVMRMRKPGSRVVHAYDPTIYKTNLLKLFGTERPKPLSELTWRIDDDGLHDSESDSEGTSSGDENPANVPASTNLLNEVVPSSTVLVTEEAAASSTITVIEKESSSTVVMAEEASSSTAITTEEASLSTAIKTEEVSSPTITIITTEEASLSTAIETEETSSSTVVVTEEASSPTGIETEETSPSTVIVTEAVSSSTVITMEEDGAPSPSVLTTEETPSSTVLLVEKDTASTSPVIEEAASSIVKDTISNHEEICIPQYDGAADETDSDDAQQRKKEKKRKRENKEESKSEKKQKKKDKERKESKGTKQKKRRKEAGDSEENREDDETSHKKIEIIAEPISTAEISKKEKKKKVAPLSKEEINQQRLAALQKRREEDRAARYAVIDTMSAALAGSTGTKPTHIKFSDDEDEQVQEKDAGVVTTSSSWSNKPPPESNNGKKRAYAVDLEFANAFKPGATSGNFSLFGDGGDVMLQDDEDDEWEHEIGANYPLVGYNQDQAYSSSSAATTAANGQVYVPMSTFFFYFNHAGRCANIPEIGPFQRTQTAEEITSAWETNRRDLTSEFKRKHKSGVRKRARFLKSGGKGSGIGSETAKGVLG